MTLVAKKIKTREGIENPDLFLKQKTQEWADGLGSRKFMGGDVPNGADIAVYGITESVTGLRAGDLFRQNTVYAAWMDRIFKLL